MPTDRYVYLRVSEGKHEFWIATRKQEVEKGSIYYYKGGLLKTHFESKEYQKVFDTIYLVSSLVPENHSKGMMLPSSGAPASMPPAVIKEDIPMHSEKPVTQKVSLPSPNWLRTRRSLKAIRYKFTAPV